MKAQKNRIMHRLRGATAYCLYCVLLPIVFASPCLGAADMDGDGLDDAWETANGYSTLLYTRIVYVDAVNGDDAGGDGRTATTALASLRAALEQSFDPENENVVLLAPGIYSGSANRGLDFNGVDVWLRSSAGPSQTFIDLEGEGPFLELWQQETLDSRMEGLTIRNGSTAWGAAVHLENASLDIRNCVFEYNRQEDSYGGPSAAVFAAGAPIRITDTVFRGNDSVGMLWWDLDTAGAVLLCNSDGSVIDRCDFIANRGYGAGAVSVCNSVLTIRCSRFLNNFSYWNGGAVSASSGWYTYYYVYDSEEDPPETCIQLENCLLLGNRAAYDYSDVFFADGGTAVIRNATIAGGASRDGHAISPGEAMTVVNSIVRGSVPVSTGIRFTAMNNCTTNSWSSFGTGNIASDPKLTDAGMLMSGSPCIDAGTSDGAPASDLLGNLRPAGLGVDIGCHELLDTDADGIPDFLEGVDGVLPGGDEDGDGVPNLQEYLYGTDIFGDDTDGDGMDDGEEIQRGMNPLLPANVIFVSPAGDNASDGLTAATAKETFAGAIALASECGRDNIIIAAGGTYSGPGNRALDIIGLDVSIKGSSGPQSTIIDLGGQERFLTLTGCMSRWVRLENLTIRHGSAQMGSAIYAIQSAPRFFSCIFEENDAIHGGALYLDGSEDSLLTGCAFTGNTAHDGAAIFIGGNGGATVLNSVFSGNLATFGGGAICHSGGKLVVRNASFTYNLSRGDGGAVELEGLSSAASFSDCLFKGNRSISSASSISGYESEQFCSLSGCTFMNGSSSDSLACCFNGTADIRNSIFTDGIGYSAERPPLVSHCALPSAELASLGNGNISSDPMLTGAGMLKRGSPCIDAGTSSGASSTDLFGDARPAGNGVDIGCHEFLDTDGDGIPDRTELEAGMDPLDSGDAEEDEDGDGLANLREYLIGTDIFSSDTDDDGIDDTAETASDFDPLRSTLILFVSPSGNDSDDGKTIATAKRTLASVVTAMRNSQKENVVRILPGTYAGSSNRGLDFMGSDIKLVSAAGSSRTVIDLEGEGPFLRLSRQETLCSRIDGLTIRNGFTSSCGIAVHLENASLDIRNCVFENNCSGRGNSSPSAAVVACGAPVHMTGTVFKWNSSLGMQWGDADSSGAVLLINSVGNVIKRCDFIANCGYSAGAVAAYDAELEVCCSRFLNNLSYWNGGAVSGYQGWYYLFDYYYGYDEVEQTPDTSVVLENCLFLGNRAQSDCSDMYFCDGGTAHIRNTTIAEGSSRYGHSVRLEDDSDIVNSIILGTVSLNDGMSFSAMNNCTPNNWSVFGTGNIASDPMLTGAGMLKQGSPCIDAGTSSGAPSSDLFGNTRPAGNRVDIGCHEFLDTDSDGIPDFLEGGEGVLPVGDGDGDGVSNLQEYLLGTGIFEEDTDGDGMGDGDELTRGCNPLLPANIVYVSPSGHDEADGRTPATARATFAAALELARRGGTENIVYAAAGTYAGADNRSLDYEGFDISIRGAVGREHTVIDLGGGACFLSLRQGETCRSQLSGLTFVRNQDASPVIKLDSAKLTISGCRFRNFSRYGNPNDYMFYDHDFSSACVLRLVNSSCRLEDVEIAYCSYSPDCPLFSGSNSEISLDRCRIVGNETGCGPLFRVYGTAIHMVNTMVAKNNVASTGGIAILYGDSLLRTVNSTFAANAPSAAASISGDGAVDMLNTVFEDLVSGCGVSLSHCVVAPAYADAASGCISGGAGLAGGLFLTPDSPCIDAGAQSGAPDVDFAGTPRPQGAGVDIGCEEYRDFDGDGISDFYSAWCGGNLSADGDLDGDGLSNLQEMNIGTDAGSSDTDGDGMADGWEISSGLDPLHDDADDDPDGDGLVNIEEFSAGTDPSASDTDGDGQSDGWEVKTAFSDPAAADFNGSSDSVVIVTGNLFSDSGGGWEADGSGACARGRAGWLQYSMQIPYDGVYLLELEVSEAGTASAGSFTVSCRVDGASCGSLLRIPLDASLSGTGVCMTPFLRTGLHSVRIDWDNVYRNTSLRVDSVRLVALGGPDADGDGVPDWAETRLANMSCTVLPERSRVSPLCVEGGNASYIEAIEVSGYYVAPGGDDPHPPVRRIAGNRWYADLPLDPDGTTPVSVAVSYQNSAVTVSGDVLWETVDTASLDGDTVRLDDEMLLGAELPEGVLEWTLEVGGTSFRMTRGEVRRHKFTTAGDVPVTASWTEAGGEAVSNEAVVHVLSADFGSEPVCHAGTERTWRIAGIGDGIHVEIDRDVQSTDLGCSAGARRFLLRGAVPAIAHATARVAENGPVLDTTAVHVIETATHVGDGYHRVIADFGDGTVLYDGYVVAGQVVEGMSVTVTLWGTNSTFEDGTQEKTFTWQSFDAAGELHFSILGGRSFTTCMTVILYQDGEMVWNLQ